MLAFILISLTAAAPARAKWSVNSLGWLIYQPDSQVLGDEDEKKEEKGEGVKKEEPKQQEKKNEVEYFDAGQNAWIKAKTEDGKTKTEIKTLTGQEQKTETERDGFKLKLKSEAGILKLEAETEDGEEVELGEDEEVEIEPDEDDDKIRVATGSGEGEMTISRNQVRARTNFPLSVDLNTNELIVTTPAGVKRVTILPDQAIANLLANNVIDRVEPAAGGELELTEEDGIPAYAVEGESDQEFLGFLPVKIKAKLKVSAETGEVLSTQKPALIRLLDLFSF